MMKTIVSVIVLLSMLAATLLSLRRPALPEGALRLEIFDIGQGDAALLRTPEGMDIVIDGGPSDEVVAKLSRTRPATDRRIELLIPTHPDADHVLGLPEIAARYEIGAVAQSPFQKSLPEIDALFSETNHQGVKAWIIDGERIVKLNAHWTLHLLVLDPRASTSNDAGVITMLTNGSVRALLMADVSSAVESRLLSRYPDWFPVDLLKIGHHGSCSSTGAEFLDRAKPRMAVISVGEKNRYGHPCRRVMNELEERGISVFRTDLRGDLSFELRGSSILPR